MRRRAAYEGLTPLFAYHYGIRPWELDLLTVRELELFRDDMTTREVHHGFQGDAHGADPRRLETS